MRRNHGPRLMRSGWPVRRFVVAEDSMRPALLPGDGLLAVRSATPKRGQLRVFPDPLLSSRYLVKRVGQVRLSATGSSFEALSDNAGAPGATDSREFGLVPTGGSFRVLWTVRAKRRRRPARGG